MSRYIAPDDPGRLAFAEIMAAAPVVDGEAEPPAPDPRPTRPAGSIDQGARGLSISTPFEAWRHYLSERLR